MYTYVRAVGISRTLPQGEEPVDISAVPCNTLSSLYSRLIIVIHDEIANLDVALNAYDYLSPLNGYGGTIQQWLVTQASVQLKTTNTLPGTEYAYVTQRDIQYMWFTPLPGEAAIAEDRQGQLTTSSAKDIRLVKTDNTEVDFDALEHKCLWTVNGHLTRAVKGQRSLYLINAGKHFNVYDNLHINCLNFNQVSDLNCYPLTADMFSFVDNDTYNFLHVKSPVDLTGKTVWMSIGGRLYAEDVVRANGARGLSINTAAVDWFSRIFESKELIDLSPIIDKEREVVPANFFKTADFFTQLMLSPSTFLIVLDNPHLYKYHVPLDTYQYPFTFHRPDNRKIPLISNTGLFLKYFERKIINRRLLDVDIGARKRYLNETTGLQNEGNLFHGFNSRVEPSELYQGYSLYIRGLV